MAPVRLRKADKVALTVLVDNFSDHLMNDTPVAKRLRTKPPQAPLAEHGLSFLISVYAGTEKHTLLMDGGISGTCLNHNAKLFKSSMAVLSGAVGHAVEDVEGIVLSHGHFDHFGGLPAFLEARGEKLPVVVHPGAFADRRAKLSPDVYTPLPSLHENDLVRAGAVLERRAAVSTTASDLVLISGQVPRRTSFEKGSPRMEIHSEGEWRIDPFDDDQALAIDLKGWGLVVIGGCCHAGIINTIEYLCRSAGAKTVYAVFGGFHLSGADEGVISRTVQEMQRIGPGLIAPMHCTGWSATSAFAAAMPDQFILNTVGT
ncbi:MAG: MBL fold metallo-hydrolase, partial [Desulfosarcinaceae bacterium]